MTEERVPVFVQLPGDTEKTRAGELAWNAATHVGAFIYADDYLRRKGA